MGTKGDRPIPDLEGSTLLHVSGQLFVDAVTGMVLSRVGSVGSLGYERVHIEDRDVTAHRVVWSTINGPIPEAMTINHRDGNKQNNRPDNLELATQGDQLRHAYALGLRTNEGQVGRFRRSRLTEEQIEKLREAEPGHVMALADELGISRSYAYAIRGRRGLRTHV